MKPFVGFAVAVGTVVVGLSFGYSLYQAEGGELEDTNLKQIEVDENRDCRDVEDSWADGDTPDSGMFPVKPGGIASSAGFNDPARSNLRFGYSITRTRNEAFSEFHKRFLAEFINLDDWEHYYLYNSLRSHGMGHRRPQRDVNNLFQDGFLSWYILEWRGYFMIEPKRFLIDNDFHFSQIDLASKEPFLRVKDPCALNDNETLGNPQLDFERSMLTSDPLTRLLETSNDRATRTEWKITRLQMIGLMKHSISGSDNYHRVPRVGETQEASPEDLNAFEQSAIEQLEADPMAKVVTNISGGDIQVMGVLRANHTCLECHQVNLHAPIGVFRYKLMRVNPTPTSVF